MDKIMQQIRAGIAAGVYAEVPRWDDDTTIAHTCRCGRLIVHGLGTARPACACGERQGNLSARRRG